MPDTSKYLVTVVISLLLVIGLFFVIIRLVAKGTRGANGRVARSLGGLPLGQNKSVQVVEIGGSYYILGVGDTITLIAKVEEQEEVDAIRQASGFGRNESQKFPAFSEWLSRKRTNVEPVSEELTDFGKVFHDRMVTMTNRRRNVEEWMQEDSSRTRKAEDNE